MKWHASLPASISVICHGKLPTSWNGKMSDSAVGRHLDYTFLRKHHTREYHYFCFKLLYGNDKWSYKTSLSHSHGDGFLKCLLYICHDMNSAPPLKLQVSLCYRPFQDTITQTTHLYFNNKFYVILGVSIDVECWPMKTCHCPVNEYDLVN